MRLPRQGDEALPQPRRAVADDEDHEHAGCLPRSSLLLGVCRGGVRHARRADGLIREGRREHSTGHLARDARKGGVTPPFRVC